MSERNDGVNISNIELHDNFCQSMEELLNSKDFVRVFTIIVAKSNKFDVGYITEIFTKIQLKRGLSEREVKDFLLFLSDKEVIRLANNLVSKLKGFTIEEVLEFLEKYSVEQIITEITERVKTSLLITINNKETHAEYIYSHLGYNFFSYNNGGKTRYCVKKADEKNNHLEYDEIHFLVKPEKNPSLSLTIYASENGKLVIIKLDKLGNVSEKIELDYGPDGFYRYGDYAQVMKNGKIGYINIQFEPTNKSITQDLVFDQVSKRFYQDVNGGPLIEYFEGKIGSESYEVEFGKLQEALAVGKSRLSDRYDKRY